MVNYNEAKQERSIKMSYRLTLGNIGLMNHIQEKTDNVISTIRDFKNKHKSFFMKCAVTYMAVKIGIILLASFAALVYLTSHVTQYLAIEMSQTKALLFATPLTMIVVLKLYFIFRMLMTYDRSRMMIQIVFNAMVLKGNQGVWQVGELSSVSWEKVRNQ